MSKILGYLKPFLLGVALVFVLLFAQALCDLNLPNYMSDIVNVGIQQGGIEHAAPQQISGEALAFMQGFMTDAEAALADASYSEQAGICVRVDTADLDALSRAFENAAATLFSLGQSMAASGAQAGEASMQSLEMSQLYAFEPMLKMIPESSLDAARAQAEALPDAMRASYGIGMCKAYYDELGMVTSSLQQGYIRGVGLKMLLIALLGGIATVLVGLLSARIAAGAAKKLRSDVFAHVSRFSQAEINKFGAASLITRTTNDITQVQTLFQMGARMVLYAPIMCIGGVLMALQKSPSMSWIIALSAIVMICLITMLFSIVTSKFKLIQKLVDRLNLVSREHLSGLMVIRAFGTRDYEERRFDEVNRDVTGVTRFVNRMMSVMMPMMMFIMSGTSLLVLWVGAGQIAQSNMQVGDMMAFMQYASQVIMSFLMLSMVFVFFPRAAVSANRIAEVLNTEPAIVDPQNPVAFDPQERGVVRFEGVSFKYDGAEEYALKDITFAARPGQTTAIIGATGSGKSTIAGLILRFFDATEGSVRVAGADVRQVPQQALRRQIGYVPQNGTLLMGTVKSNLNYGNREATDEQIRESARVAQALSFIVEMPQGLDSAVAQGGGNVSGGQRQRLSIARALAKEPDIFIFDDSFSALDFTTDRTLRAALREHTAGATILIIAQRISTIRTAEQILVLDQGRIVGSGTHAELMQVCSQYQEIARSQLSEEELA